MLDTVPHRCAPHAHARSVQPKEGGAAQVRRRCCCSCWLACGVAHRRGLSSGSALGRVEQGGMRQHPPCGPTWAAGIW